MPYDLYAGIAERYDRFHGEFGLHDPVIAEFFRQLFGEYQVRSVLDCACGTGQHLPLFLSLECEVTGSDASDAMLAQARGNLAEFGVEVPLHRADYRELAHTFEEKFDAVMCLSSSILHMPTKADVLRAFGSMRSVLRDGGILVLTQGTTDKQWTQKPRFILGVNDSEFTRLFVIDYEGEGATYNIVDIRHTDEANDLEVWRVEYARVYLAEDQEQLLRASGFGAVHLYGGYDLEPYDTETSDRLIIVARK